MSGCLPRGSASPRSGARFGKSAGKRKLGQQVVGREEEDTEEYALGWWWDNLESFWTIRRVVVAIGNAENIQPRP